MPSTPPPVALRAHTPPTPLHGPRYDNYEPYSLRRSKRSTAQSNPYSSFNSDRSPRSSFQRSTPPPTATKKARFARAPTQLSSPPSSPASPRKQLHKTPRKSASHSQSQPKLFTNTHSDSDAGPSTSLLAPPTIDPITMLPTPSKTPNKKRSHAAAITRTARILSFQPNHPNDVMPSPRKIKKSAHRSLSSRAGFELYEDDMADANGERSIEIYTDANARVPVLDESEDNPFVGPRNKTGARPQRRRGRRSSADAEMEERAERGEGVVYVFRGKKIFRPYQSADEDNEEETPSIPDTDQRRLRHQAGPAAQRPLTRSTIKPRLLFPSAEQRAERERGVNGEGGVDDVDEEAVTDIEMDNTATHPNLPVDIAAANGSLASPPPTHHKEKGRSVKATIEFTPAPVEEEGEPMSLGTDESFSSASGTKGKGRSPFDSWQRTKGGRKRAGEANEEGSGKRTRSAVVSFEEVA